MSVNVAANENLHIRCKVIIEILGKPKEHVENSSRMYVDKIKIDPELILLKEDFAKAEEKEGLWSTFVELEMVVKGVRKLIAFCFDYMPSSVQILKPDEFSMSRSFIEDFANDLQARLHQVDMVVKQQKNENEFLKKNMNTTIKNMILIALASQHLNKEILSKITGIPEQELQPFLDDMADKKKIKEKDGFYMITLHENGEHTEK